tara:strand:+ start:6258 stop:7175 length:918 start_codon:yes stop_codon:yes gene_type:complete
MANKFYPAVALTGGGTGALDKLDGTDLVDLDAGFVQLFQTVYFYTLDDNSGAGESSPTVISPDANAGTKRWVLQSVNATNLTAEGVIQLKERAEADSNIAAYGQIWVDLATPNILMFTDDADTDFAVEVAGKNTIWIPASAMRPTTSNGCAAITDVETTAGRPDMQTLDFDAAADTHAQFQIAMPKSWDEGTVTAQFFWKHAGGQTGGLDGVAFAIQGVAASSDDTIDVAYGTAVAMTAVDGATAEDLYSSAETSAVTIAGTPAAGDVCFFRVLRDVSDAGDDLDIDAGLIGIKLFITTNAGNDT